jgi:site-specific DNA recombinase
VIACLEDPASSADADRAYVGRILRLTSLAPEIVRRILDGDEPKGISLAKLRTNLPVAWAEQGWG